MAGRPLPAEPASPGGRVHLELLRFRRVRVLHAAGSGQQRRRKHCLLRERHGRGHVGRRKRSGFQH
ncbi:MAG: hypothetical protein MZV64_37035 [Ignavibacteriales bacterium]|nr:hypothetical protein [Ignavibacteriales bacterium]